jgi:hypothetical protein
MSRTQSFDWFLKFKNDITFVEDVDCMRHCFTMLMELCISISSHRTNAKQ